MHFVCFTPRSLTKSTSISTTPSRWHTRLCLWTRRPTGLWSSSSPSPAARWLRTLPDSQYLFTIPSGTWIRLFGPSTAWPKRPQLRHGPTRCRRWLVDSSASGQTGRDHQLRTRVTSSHADQLPTVGKNTECLELHKSLQIWGEVKYWWIDTSCRLCVTRWNIVSHA